MKNIILQPSANPAAQKHFAETIKRPVSIERIAKFVSLSDATRLRDLYPSGDIPTWGATAGEKNVLVSRWNRIAAGDLVLFLWDHHVRASGYVTHKLHNADLARNLWSLKKGQPFEYVFFLTDIDLTTKVPYRLIREAAGYKPNWNPLQLVVIGDHRKDRILDVVGINESSSADDPREGNEEDLRAAAKLDPSMGVDAKGMRALRREQGFLRKSLFGRKQRALCGLCQRELPTRLIVVAHVKKRAECSEVERCDHQHVVMPMCKLGCDDLYEAGFIVVREGKIQLVQSQAKLMEGAALEYARSLDGKPCTHWNESTKAYFEWHSNKALGARNV